MNTSLEKKWVIWEAVGYNMKGAKVYLTNSRQWNDKQVHSTYFHPETYFCFTFWQKTFILKLKLHVSWALCKCWSQAYIYRNTEAKSVWSSHVFNLFFLHDSLHPWAGSRHWRDELALSALNDQRIRLQLSMCWWDICCLLFICCMKPLRNYIYVQLICSSTYYN